MKIGFLNLLTLVLLVLKTTGVLNIGWVLVFVPTIVSAGLGILILLFVVGVAIIASIVEEKL